MPAEPPRRPNRRGRSHWFPGNSNHSQLWNKSNLVTNSCLPTDPVLRGRCNNINGIVETILFCPEPLSPSTCETFTGILIKINPPLVAFQLLMAAPSHPMSGGSSARDPFDWPRGSPWSNFGGQIPHEISESAAKCSRQTSTRKLVFQP